MRWRPGRSIGLCDVGVWAAPRREDHARTDVEEADEHPVGALSLTPMRWRSWLIICLVIGAGVVLVGLAAGSNN